MPVTLQRSRVHGAVKEKKPKPSHLCRCRGVADLTQDDKQELVKVRVCVCDVCRWVFGEGWIITKLMIMVAKQQYLLNTSLCFRW